MAGAPKRQIHTAPPHQQQRLLPMVRKLVVPDAMNCNPRQILVFPTLIHSMYLKSHPSHPR
ncbi:BQ5605_C001g00177 [Microbotryum silenes-dioicae]|uniref:BQ5605_C001g00177 protein n=1 Tax=Microbotryum silenes-dioicae TaxID=796604 RepID=A0A2X0M6V0_9BASI|nr:BQ5605_C001g00177 [Microbotryum silenes-dioicae]